MPQPLAVATALLGVGGNGSGQRAEYGDALVLAFQDVSRIAGAADGTAKCRYTVAGMVEVGRQQPLGLTIDDGFENGEAHGAYPASRS